MSFLSSLRDHITALVHADALPCPVERARHTTFMATRLGSSLAAMLVLPPYLIYHGLPAPWEAMAFIWLMLPLAAVAHVSRSGKLVEAQAVCLVAGLGLVVTLSLAGGSGAATAWLLLVPVEAALAARTWLILAGASGALVAAIGLALAVRFHALGAAHGADLLTNLAFVVPGLCYATGLALGLQSFAELRRSREQASAARYGVLCDAMGDLVLRMDRYGSVIHVGREAQALFGINPADLAGRGLFDRVHVGDRPSFLRAVADAATADDLVIATLRLRCAVVAGRRVAEDETAFAWVELRIRLVAGGDPGPILAILRDVTGRKNHEEALEAARLEAEQSNAWKDRFLANVSHELRTPLNAIIGFAELLASEQLAPKEAAKQREYAHIIRASGGHLLEVVNTILDMSKIESGSFEILPEPFDLVPLIDLCCDMVRLKAEQAGIGLLRSCPPGLPELIADKRACKQILINLLSNAVKFTPTDGCVTVGARPEGSGIVLYVNDTGIGILQSDLPRLGDPFFQAQASHDRRYEGTGLGLSVVRGLVGLHGGTISIESAPGAGTSVKVKLPLDCRPALRSRAAAIDVLPSRAVMHRQAFDIGSATVKKIA